MKSAHLTEKITAGYDASRTIINNLVSHARFHSYLYFERLEFQMKPCFKNILVIEN